MATIFEQAKNKYSYKEFSELAEVLLKEGKTTGTNQSESYIHYARLNLQRMHRWEKTFALPEEIAAMAGQVTPQDWWVITEGWCGDSAQNLPMLQKIADASNGKITLRIVLRDENPEIMERYLTNGSKSIPILAVFNKQDEEIFRWGPRPEPAQALLSAWKADPNPKSFEDFEVDMQQWYNADKGRQLMKEIQPLLQN